MKIIKADMGVFFRVRSDQYTWCWGIESDATPIPDQLAPALAELLGAYCHQEMKILDAPAKVTVGWAVKSRLAGSYATREGWQPSNRRFLFTTREAAEVRALGYNATYGDRAVVVRVVKKVKS